MTIGWSQRTWPEPDAHVELAKLQADMDAGTWVPSEAVLKAALAVVYWSEAPVEQACQRALQALGIPRRGGDARFARLPAFLAYASDNYPDFPWKCAASSAPSSLSRKHRPAKNPFS